MNDVVGVLFEQERDLPYRIPLTATEPDHTCIGKHLRLAQALRSHGLVVRFRIAHFRWSDLPLPEHVLEVPRVNDSTHMYLEVENNQEWSIVDATWDIGLVSRCAYELSLPSVEVDNTANKAFFFRLNQWLEEVRQQKSSS